CTTALNPKSSVFSMHSLLSYVCVRPGDNKLAVKLSIVSTIRFNRQHLLTRLNDSDFQWGGHCPQFFKKASVQGLWAVLTLQSLAYFR
ncbi:hypothetical protein, partial [Stenomitos frigidus]|uniref:hypothetical protein n=1 Tax=Stenomitos frigidus TaxID=1886765 RepID=UPI001C6352F9